jgi:hypothetical protein
LSGTSVEGSFISDGHNTPGLPPVTYPNKEKYQEENIAGQVDLQRRCFHPRTARFHIDHSANKCAITQLYILNTL